jgi:hypothetical protein
MFWVDNPGQEQLGEASRQDRVMSKACWHTVPTQSCSRAQAGSVFPRAGSCRLLFGVARP